MSPGDHRRQARLSRGVLSRQGDGWINDAVTGAGLLNNNRWGARGQLLYTGDEITDR